MGIVSVCYFNTDGEPTEHTLNHIFTGTNSTGELVSTEHSKPFWAQESSLGELDYILPGTLEILELIEAHPKSPFFADWQFEF